MNPITEYNFSLYFRTYTLLIRLRHICEIKPAELGITQSFVDTTARNILLNLPVPFPQPASPGTREPLLLFKKFLLLFNGI